MNRNSRPNGPVLVQIRPSVRRPEIRPKNGEKFVALVAGGHGDMYRQIKEHIERFRPVVAPYHWEKVKDFARPIPAEVDLVIVIVNYMGHKNSDRVQSEAKARGLTIVYSQHKWAEMSQRLDATGIPKTISAPVPVNATALPKPKVVVGDGPVPLRQRIVIAPRLPVRPSPPVTPLPSEPTAEEITRKKAEDEEFEREFQKLVAEEEAKAKARAAAPPAPLPPLEPLGPLSCIYEPGHPSVPNACVHCGGLATDEIHSQERQEAAQRAFMARLGRTPEPTPEPAEAKPTKLKKSKEPTPEPVEYGVDELARMLAKAMKRERVEEVTLKFNEHGKAVVTIVEAAPEEP